MTSFGQISLATAEQLASSLNNKAFAYSISPVDKELADAEVLMNIELKRYDSDRFYGVMIDTGVSVKSTVGYDQYKAYNTFI